MEAEPRSSAAPDAAKLSGFVQVRTMVGRSFRNANQPCIVGRAISLA